jgi:glucose-1-phosphate thymidylyltransferase
MRVVGVIPGGGNGRWLRPSPCSQELLTIGFRATSQGPRPRVVSSYLLDSMREAGIEQVFWLLDRSKTDIVQYFGNGAEVGVQLAYVPTLASASVVHTLDGARTFLSDAQVLFGFPDVIVEPVHALRSLRQRLLQGRADVVLAALPVPPEQSGDRLRLDGAGRVLELRLEPSGSDWPHAWVLAAWAPSFTRFLERWVLARESLASAALQPVPAELSLGQVLQAAIEAKLTIEAETFPLGSFIDIGTAPGLAAALRRYGTLGLDAPSHSEASGR